MYKIPSVPDQFGWGGIGFGEELKTVVDEIVANGEDHETRVTDLEEAVEALDPEALEGVEGLGERLDAVEGILGDEEEGMVKDVADLETTVGGEETGLVKDVADLQAAVDALDPEILGGVEGLDERIDALEVTVDTETTGLVDKVAALEETIDTAETGVVDRLEAVEATLDTAETGVVDRVDALEATIDTAETGLVDRVEAVEATLDTAETGLVDRVEAVEATLDTAETGLVDRVEDVEATLDTAETGVVDRLEAVEATLDTAETGLVDRVEDVEATLDTAETGIVDRVEALEATVDTAETGLVDRVGDVEATLDTAETGIVDRVEAVEATLDTAETGLVDRVEALETAVGDEESGIVKDIDDLQAEVSALDINMLRKGTIALAGRSPTKILFQDSIAATLLGDVVAPFALDHGDTFIVTGDGTEQTITFSATAGKHTGATSPITDMTLETDTQFKIAVNGDLTAHLVTCVWTACDEGAEVAAAMEDAIQALGDDYAAVTVIYDTNKYVITSGQKGTGSKVRITRADTLDCCDELKIADLGADSDGAGDAVDITETSLAEFITKAAGLNKLTATDGTTGIRLTSKTTGSDSSLVIGAGTANAALGFVQAAEDFGSIGLGYETDMADANYVVMATLSGVDQASIVGLGLSINSKATAGFEIECEDDTSTEDVAVLIFGSIA
jgi:peptidoglycan hydrolase CwlO-like protein